MKFTAMNAGAGWYNISLELGAACAKCGMVVPRECFENDTELQEIDKHCSSKLPYRPLPECGTTEHEELLLGVKKWRILRRTAKFEATNA